MNNISIKYILWDIDATLLDFDKAEKLAMQECFKEFGFGNCTNKQLNDYKQINSKYWKRLERKEISKKEVLEGRFYEFFSKYDIDTSRVPEFNAKYQICIGNEAYYNKNAEETVKALQRKYKQYGATNGTVVAQRIKIAKCGLDKLLEDVFISEEIGYDKPAVEYFKAVFNKIGSNNPNDYLIVGDSLTSDIQGGNNVGIKTCWFNPTEKENNKNLKIDYEIKDLKEIITILES